MLLVVALAVTAGALVQGVVGLGLGLVAAPVVTLADPGLMPGLMLWVAVALPLLTLLSEWRAVDWHGLGWAFVGRVAGTAGGVLVVARAPARVLGASVAAIVLVAVAVSLRSPRLAASRPALVGAGVVSGVTGTATSIGGPPLAVLYARSGGDTVRATLAVYFVGGALLSLAGLTLGGQAPADEGVLAAMMLPFAAAGFGLAQPLRRRVDGARLRVAVLAVCAASAVTLLLRSLLA